MEAHGTDEVINPDELRVNTGEVATDEAKDKRLIILSVITHFVLVYVVSGIFCFGTKWLCKDWWEQRTLMVYISYAFFLAMRLICHVFLEVAFENGFNKRAMFVYLSVHEFVDFIIMIVAYIQTLEIDEDRAVPSSLYSVLLVFPISAMVANVVVFNLPSKAVWTSPESNSEALKFIAFHIKFAMFSLAIPCAMVLTGGDDKSVDPMKSCDAFIYGQLLNFSTSKLLEGKTVTANPQFTGLIAVKIIWMGNLILGVRFGLEGYSTIAWVLSFVLAPFCLLMHAFAVVPTWRLHNTAIKQAEHSTEPIV